MKISTATFVKGIRGTDEILTDGVPQIAFIGRSNVGKSSLINAILEIKGLAKEGKKPGKTKEINFFLINKQYYVVDLPGYGYAETSPKEKDKLKKLIIWYFTYSDARPKEIVIVLDIKAGLTQFDEDMIMILKDQKHPLVIVANKIDKLTQKDLSEQVAQIKGIAGDTEVLLCSAKMGKGIEAVKERLFT